MSSTHTQTLYKLLKLWCMPPHFKIFLKCLYIWHLLGTWTPCFINILSNMSVCACTQVPISEGAVTMEMFTTPGWSWQAEC